MLALHEQRLRVTIFGFIRLMKMYRSLFFLFPFAAAFLVAAHADIVEDVRISMGSGAFTVAESQLNSYRAQKGVTAEYIEASSWMARGSLIFNKLDQADSFARSTEQQALPLLKKRKMDAEPHLPLALGAAIEVQAQVLTARGKPTQAVALLQRYIRLYRDTSIRNRLQKNLNLLALVGKPAPALQVAEYLGPKPVPLAQLKGSPVLLFFWAHWCGDCKGEAPVIARLRNEFAGKGLVVQAPTQRYGYAAGGQEVGPAAELAYIKDIRAQYFAALADVPAPISQENLSLYGVSTTPTLVVLDRAGKVSFYHPGALSYQELRAAIERVL